jgi:tetratricopeptide (TPR) repeat protein
VYMRRGEHAESLVWCDRGLRSPVADVAVGPTLDLLITRATVLGAEGRQTESVALMRGAMVMAEQHGLTEVQVRAQINLSFVTVTDEPRVAFEASRQGLDLALRYGMASYLVYLVSNYVSSGESLGEWDGAEAALESALQLNLGADTAWRLRAHVVAIRAARGETYADFLSEPAPRLDEDPQSRAGWASVQASVALCEGRYREATTFALQSIDEFPEAVTPFSQATVGRAGLWSGDPAPARTALERLDTRGGRALRAVRAELEAGIAALDGRIDEAGAAFAALQREQADLGIAFEGALSRITAVAVLPPGTPLAIQAANEARETLTRLRAVRLLERLDEVLARVGGGHSPRDGAPVSDRDAPSPVAADAPASSERAS